LIILALTDNAHDLLTWSGLVVTVANRLDEDGKVLTPEEILYRVCNFFSHFIFWN